MAKRAKRRRAREAAKLRPRAVPAAGGEPVEQGPSLLGRAARESVENPLEDLRGDEAAQDAWLLEREAEDIQREEH